MKPITKYKQVFSDDDVATFQISDHIWFIQEKKVVASSVFIIEGSEKTMVIDGGMHIKDLPSYVRRLSNKPIIFAITHGHGDHCGSMDDFDTVYVHKDESSMLENHKCKIVKIDYGYVFDLGNIHISVFSLKGHTPGSIGFLDSEDRCIFTGDGIGSTFVWIWTSDDPLEGFLDLLKSLDELKGKYDRIYVGHMDQMTFENDPTYIDTLKELCEKILYTKEVQGSPYFGHEDIRKIYPHIKPFIATYGKIELVYNPENLYYK